MFDFIFDNKKKKRLHRKYLIHVFFCFCIQAQGLKRFTDGWADGRGGGNFVIKINARNQRAETKSTN